MPGDKLRNVTPTIRQVHEALLNSKSIDGVASKLGLKENDKLVGDFVHLLYHKVSTSYEVPNNIRKKYLEEHLPNQAAFEKYFGKGCYDTPCHVIMHNTKTKIEKITFHQVHDLLKLYPKISNQRLSLYLGTSYHFKEILSALGLTYDKSLKCFNTVGCPLGGNTEAAKAHYENWYDKSIINYLDHFKIKYDYYKPKAQSQHNHKQQIKRTDPPQAEIPIKKRSTPRLNKTDLTLFHPKRKKPESVSNPFSSVSILEPPLKSMKSAATTSHEEIDPNWLNNPAILDELCHLLSPVDDKNVIPNGDIEPTQASSRYPTLPRPENPSVELGLFEKKMQSNQADNEFTIPSPLSCIPGKIS